MPKPNLAYVRKYYRKNRDIILPALCVFGCGLAIGLALRGSKKGTSIKILASNGSSVALDDVIITGAYASNIVLGD